MSSWIRTILLGGVLFASSAGVVVGFWRAQAYDTTAGAAADTATLWPAGCSLARTPGQSTLILAVHPECPCSRATLAELAKLMTRCQGRLQAYVLFAHQSNLSPDRTATDLWNLADLTGVTRLRDDQHVAARHFGARTSGQVLLYDPRGCLQFNGGITSARGHAGDNDGSAAIEQFILAGKSPLAHTPVFGCALQ